MGAPRPPELALREPCAEPPARSETHSQPGEAHLTLPEHSTSDFKPGTLRADAPPHLGVPLAPHGLHPVCAHVPHRKPGTVPCACQLPSDAPGRACGGGANFAGGRGCRALGDSVPRTHDGGMPPRGRDPAVCDGSDSQELLDASCMPCDRSGFLCLRAQWPGAREFAAHGGDPAGMAEGLVHQPPGRAEPSFSAQGDAAGLWGLAPRSRGRLALDGGGRCSWDPWAAAPAPGARSSG